MPAVALHHLAHAYGDVRALRGVTLDVATGERFGLLGPNGSGKTTLFRVLTTLLRPDAGTATVFSHDVTQAPDAVRAQLGVIFQQTALDDELTVRENLRFHGALYGLKGRALADRIAYLLDLLGLTDKADARVRTLSGGQQRRTDLARGLLHRPALLLLDEPTTGLDPLARRTFWDAMDTLQRQENTTVIVATHLFDEAERCDRIGVLNEGTLAVTGTPDALTDGLGQAALWLTSDTPASLQQAIEAQFGLAVQPVGQALRITADDAPALLPRLYDTFADQITSATVRPPSLEDVFLLYTNRAPSLRLETEEVA